MMGIMASERNGQVFATDERFASFSMIMLFNPDVDLLASVLIMVL